MSNSILKQKVSLAEDVLIQDLGGESALLNLNSEEYFGLDEIGTRMLSVLLNEADSIASAHALLLEEYEVSSEKLQQDLLEFIDDLVTYGLVQITSA